MSYPLLKMLHLLGVVLFLGNIIISAWWKVMADRTRDARIIAFAQRQITWTDCIFTLGGVGLLYLAGEGLAAHLGLSTVSTSWLHHGIMLFRISAVLWIVVLIPIQAMQSRLARRFAHDGVIPQRYWTLAWCWYAVGTVATIIPTLNLYWMIFKTV